MLYPVVCITCGMPVGDLAETYAALVETSVRDRLQEYKTLPDRIQADARIKIDSEQILDSLNINSACCRIRFTTTILFSKLYNAS